MLGVNEDVEINSNDTENLQEALHRANVGSVRAGAHVSTDMDIMQFIEDHQQAEEQDQALESEEEVSCYTIVCENL
jgi:hypothetical protein